MVEMVVLESKKKMRGSIEDDVRLLPDIMWAQKPPNINDLQKT
jgi:hypothetical protein